MADGLRSPSLSSGDLWLPPGAALRGLSPTSRVLGLSASGPVPMCGFPEAPSSGPFNFPKLGRKLQLELPQAVGLMCTRVAGVGGRRVFSPN